MEALILSCSTGGGHNAAGKAVAEELDRRGHRVMFMDPYGLAGSGIVRLVSDSYVKLVQRSPALFGKVYALGESYRQLPIHSPVYWVNGKMSSAMGAFLDEHHFDVVIMSHMYPAHILTNLKRQRTAVPQTMLIATDYTCIPFMEETDCDYYVVPAADLMDRFGAYGIPRERMLPYGIPVGSDFRRGITRHQARAALRLDLNERYILLSGGSIGAGKIEETIRTIMTFLKGQTGCTLIVICGKNDQLRRKLVHRYGDDPHIVIRGSTSHMAQYMAACDLFLTKPGGLSSTEAAVLGVPLVHISPIPGCESENMAYFASRHMSVAVSDPAEELPQVLRQFADGTLGAAMKAAQHSCIDRRATDRLCDFIEDQYAEM